MDHFVSVLKEALEPTAGEKSKSDSHPVLGPETPAMYEDWPVLEFPDLNKSILDLFTKRTSESVSSLLLYELTRSGSEEHEGASIRLQTDDQLRWCMQKIQLRRYHFSKGFFSLTKQSFEIQVLNHSLTLSFNTHREYETVHGAVCIYLHWLRALTDIPDCTIPAPLLDTPEKYFRSGISLMPLEICSVEERTSKERKVTNKVPRGLAIERQAHEVETVLDSIRDLTYSASRKYQNEVTARTLSFLLNSADILLADPLSPEEMGMRVGSRVVDTLFDLWFHAVLNEEIPSPTYWRTLSALCRRWRHHVSLPKTGVFVSTSFDAIMLIIPRTGHVYFLKSSQFDYFEGSDNAVVKSAAMLREVGCQSKFPLAYPLFVFSGLSCLMSGLNVKMKCIQLIGIYLLVRKRSLEVFIETRYAFNNFHASCWSRIHGAPHTQYLQGLVDVELYPNLNVTVVESWARKLLAITVVVCRRLYGDEYCRILISDESITPFAFLPPVENDADTDLLYHSWSNLFSLLDSPADILAHDPMKNKPINRGVAVYGENAETQALSSLPLCFFLAVTAIQRMRDKASAAADVTISSRDTRDTDGTLTNDSRASFSSSTSDRVIQSDEQSSANASVLQHKSSSNTTRQDQPSPKKSDIVSQVRVLEAKQSTASADYSLKPHALQFVAHILAVNPANTPWVGEIGPRAECLLNITMEWLLAATRAKSDHKLKSEVADDSWFLVLSVKGPKIV
ncbi:hypothetical protein DICVIV_11289 [Dictyocaulus viviparus]|uniref:Ral GTPase-activating protein subunit alpha/beta N-terminal domain-containing protein n=1 Tax=Dictyocaulus viviparus TaxID=29172 RepID=A0A0D8XG60_DICVI|nr:hypothetical protein DICVIV_11289 [Dictyocaulus viviparus]